MNTQHTACDNTLNFVQCPCPACPCGRGHTQDSSSAGAFTQSGWRAAADRRESAVIYAKRIMIKLYDQIPQNC